MHRALVGLALLLSSTMAAAQTPVATPNLPPGLTAPERVLTYTRGEVRDFGTRELGVSYQYGQGATRLTTFLYARDSVWRGRPVQEALAEEVSRFKQAIEIEKSRGRYEQYTIAVDHHDSVSVTIDGATKFIPAHVIAVPYRSQGAIFVSFFYLYAFGDYWLKIRGTVPQALWQETTIPLFAPEFVRQTVGGVPAPPPGEARPRRDRHVDS